MRFKSSSYDIEVRSSPRLALRSPPAWLLTVQAWIEYTEDDSRLRELKRDKSSIVKS